MRHEFSEQILKGDDFSRINLEYFLVARDFYRENPHSAIALLGSPKVLLESLKGFGPREIANLRFVKVPLVVPRFDPHWWQRLECALRDGGQAEIEAISEQAGYYMLAKRDSGDE